MTPPRRPVPLLAALAGAGLAAVVAAAAPAAEAPAADKPAAGTPPWFSDETAAAGLVHFYVAGATGVYLFPEIIGGGGALLDYDGDGDLDVFLVQGGFLGSGKPADAVVQAPPGTPLGARLLRNDLEVLPDGTRRLRFTDVTAAAGLAAASGYGMGAAAGDYDGDGWTDLYLTNFGSNQLWRNRGDGTFEDVTARAGADDPRWSVPAAFLDFDGDGRLDLFVGNYVDFVQANNKPCLGASGARDYCGPAAYAPQPDFLLRNRGDGTFEDVTARAGLLRAYGPALGVVAADLDGDGRTDLYLANDGAPNQLWRNRGDGTFAEEGLLRGCAVNADGRAEAGMGVTAGDADEDGDLDLFLTHLDGETNTFYRNGGDGLFLDRSAASGLGPPSWRSTGFGTRWLDVDNDGWLDLLVANGAVYGVESLVRQRHPWPFGQPNQLFRNLGADGGHRFEEVSAAAGPAFAHVEASRGALFGDLDDDGDVDVIVVQANGPTRLLVNRAGDRAAWIGVELDAGGAAERPRTALGARVEVVAGGGAPVRHRWVDPGGGYASSHDPRILVGLGGSTAPVTVRVHWPDGLAEQWHEVPPGAYARLVRGGGEKLP